MSANHRYSDYDGFAWVYNKHWADKFLGRALAVMEKLILKELPPHARILDLCCGTGQLARELIERGYVVTGIDGSEEMIRFARDNAPAGEFIIEDARYFSLTDRYDAVISTFDSLNHVMSLDDLEAVFHNVHKALVDGGVFMFDMNMEQAYGEWKGSFGIVEDDHVCVVESSYSADERTGKVEITIFRLLEKRWRRSDLTLLQKCYSQQEIMSALERAGFIGIHPYSAESGLEEIYRKKPGRTFFLCHKL